MSIAADAVAETALASQAALTGTKRPPKKRTVTAKPDDKAAPDLR